MLFDTAQALIAALAGLRARGLGEAGSFDGLLESRLVINEHMTPAMKGLIDDVRWIVFAYLRPKGVHNPLNIGLLRRAVGMGVQGDYLGQVGCGDADSSAAFKHAKALVQHLRRLFEFKVFDHVFAEHIIK